MKLLVLLILLSLKISHCTKLQLTAQEELLKSMSVFDVIETNGINTIKLEKSPSPAVAPAVQVAPPQFTQINTPQALSTIIPGAPIPAVNTQSITATSTEVQIEVKS